MLIARRRSNIAGSYFQRILAGRFNLNHKQTRKSSQLAWQQILHALSLQTPQAVAGETMLTNMLASVCSVSTSE